MVNSRYLSSYHIPGLHQLTFVWIVSTKSTTSLKISCKQRHLLLLQDEWLTSQIRLFYNVYTRYYEILHAILHSIVLW